MSCRLNERVALVTAGADGIGWGITERFLAEGAKVLLTDIDATSGERAMRRAVDAGHGGSIDFMPLDATVEADVAKAIDHVIDRFGGFDTMVCNAGGPAGAYGQALDTPIELFDAAVALTLRSAFIGLRLAGRSMIERGTAGSIVTTASISAHIGGAGPAVYSAAKAAVVRLTQNMAAELAPYRIRANSISPGLILTPTFQAAGATPEMVAQLQPLAAAGSPRHIGDAAVFLASQEAAFVSGADIIIDGAAVAEGISLYRKLGI